MSFTCTRLSIDEYDGVKAVNRAIDLQDDGLKNFFLCRLLGKNFPELYDFIFSFDTFHLFNQGNMMAAILNVLFSLILCLLGTGLGVFLGRLE